VRGRTVAVATDDRRTLIMRRTRNPLAAMAIAAVLALFGLTAGTESAGAFVTAADQCGAYIYGYQYWGTEYVLEYERAGEETLYAAFAYNRIVYYGHLITVNNC
jgi:hypothetical protein